MRKNYSFVITKGIDNYYIASVPELPGVFTQAKELGDIFPRVKEAIEVYLETVKAFI
ncbi:MAG: type II toxin-antitoxin system HicB family antitoxin [Ruminiclostridium sp.]|nr:type II toxin-antitoxin system HicB family antitoxin [Ruminiclostridium sp.]